MNKIFGDNAVYQFLGMHTEKIVLGLAGLLVVAFIYMGASQQGLTDDPATLQRTINDVTTAMNRPDTWPIVEKDRLPTEAQDYRKRSLEIKVATDSSGYVGDVPLSPPLIPSRIRRDDPQLFAVHSLAVKAGTGAVAYLRDPREKLPVFAPPGGVPGAEQPQVVPDSFRQDKVLGFRPMQEHELKGRNFVVVTGLVPYNQQIEAYNASLKDAMGYEPTRDFPSYYFVVVQRTEVKTADEQPAWPASAFVKDPKFTNFFYSTTFHAGSPTVPRRASETWLEVMSWANPVNDVVDPKHLDPSLTLPPIPLVLRDLNSFLMHPGVERAKPANFVPEVDVGPLTPMDNVPFDPLNPLAPPKPADPMAKPPMPAPGAPRVPNVRPAPGPGVGPAVRPGGHRPGPGIFPGREGGPGMAGPGMNQNEPPPEHKLFRFFDVSVVPGKLYKYRVQLWLFDPNDPIVPAVANQIAGVAPGPGGAVPAGGAAGNIQIHNPPHIGYLDDKVITRIKDRRKTERAANATFWVETPWSEASPAIELAGTQTLLAGGVTQPAENEIWRHAEPAGKVVAKLFDPAAPLPVTLLDPTAEQPKGPRDIAGELEVSRSAVINFEEIGIALEPVRLEIEKHKAYPFETHATVLDLRGGEKVPSVLDRRDPKKAADGLGEMLLMDKAGNLIVRREADDAEEYKDSLLSFEKAAAGPLDAPAVGPAGIPNGFEGIPGDFIPGGNRPPKAVRPRSGS